MSDAKQKTEDIVYSFGDKVYINLTNRCPNRCDFCLRNHADGIGETHLWLSKEPSAEDVLKAFADLDTPNKKYVVFCGYGEPTECADVLAEVARALKQQGAFVRVDTNGLGDLINDKSLATQWRGLVDAVSVSLNASDAKGYDRLCHSIYGTEAYDALWAFAKSCQQVGIEVAMSVVDSIGEEEVHRCRALAKQAGIPLKVREYIENAACERSTRLKGN